MQDDTDAVKLSEEEQKKLQEMLTEANGKLLPDELEINDSENFYIFLKKALQKSKEKAKEWISLMAFAFTQRSISEQGKKEFVTKYNLAQTKIKERTVTQSKGQA